MKIKIDEWIEFINYVSSIKIKNNGLYNENEKLKDINAAYKKMIENYEK